jgi:hypothetical protein
MRNRRRRGRCGGADAHLFRANFGLLGLGIARSLQGKAVIIGQFVPLDVPLRLRPGFDKYFSKANGRPGQGSRRSPSQDRIS